MAQRRRANFFAHEARQHGDVETNNTTARPQQGNSETGIASAPEKCTKNAHFTPAKAIAVSVKARPAPAKAMTVSVKARPAPAEATTVSDKRPCCPTGPGGGTHGWWRGLAGLRDDAPSKARSADGSRAGRRPWAHKAARRRRCGGRRRDLPRCRWAVAGPGRIARQRAKPDLSTPGPTGVEGAGGTGGHGRASRRGAERSEAA